MHSRKAGLSILAAASVIILPVSGLAGGITYEDGDKYLRVGGQIQLQYHQQMPDGGETTDELFFNRLRLYFEGSTHKDWNAKIQFDLGKADEDNEVAIKDAYFQYTGWQGMDLEIGNAKFPFSREYLTSSRHLQLVERTFVGDHNYGTPQRNVGLHLRGKPGSRKVSWRASTTVASVVPDNTKLDFNTPVNRRGDDWSDGFMAGGRIDWHPFGYLKFSQGDFNRVIKATIGVAAFSWSNDGDNLSSTACTTECDVKDVTGIEVSGAFRGAGFSIDAEYNSFDSETVEAGITDGIYKNGKTTLTNASIEGGYMFADIIELVVCYQKQDADGYATAWNRTSVAANWFINRHDTKVQLTYRMGENLDGEQNNDENEVFLQTQFVF
jgi:hypothetical protein